MSYDTWKLDNGEDTAKLEAQERADEEADAKLDFESQASHPRPCVHDWVVPRMPGGHIYCSKCGKDGGANDD